MLELGSLWWVVLIAAAVVWVLAGIAWMALPHHRGDYRRLPGEDEVMRAVGRDTPPGQYCFPHCTDMSAMKDPAFVEKLERGPVGLVAIRAPGRPAMGRQLALWFGYTLLVSFLVAYVARNALPVGSPSIAVLRLTSTVAAVAYVLQPLPEAIWAGRPWSVALKSVADGLVYSLATGLVFAFAWPD